MASQPIYQFYAKLSDYEPTIWRRFQVAGNITFAQLGYITMTLYEMKANHLFHIEYSVNENIMADEPVYPDKVLRFEIDGGDSFPEVMLTNKHAATETTLKRFTHDDGAIFRMFYDHGDGWEIVLKLEEVFEDKELLGKELPRVLEGEGFGIVEDCGGPDGLESLHKVSLKRTGVEYKDLCDRVNMTNVDLSAFDIQDVNFRLKKLPRIFRDLYEYDYAPTQRSIDLLERKYLRRT